MNNYMKGRYGGEGESSKNRQRERLFSQKTFNQKKKKKDKKGKQTNKIVFTVKHARFVVSFETNSKS